MSHTSPERNYRFALVGAGGYIAPVHMKAIKETGNELVAATDPSDSVGIIDTYFPNSEFFVDFGRYDGCLERLRRQGIGVDYVSICSPNYLHDLHVRHTLSCGAHALCEKPLVIDPADLDALTDAEKESGKRIWSILQLRLHPSVRALKDAMDASPPDAVHDIDVTYITPRGRWYFASWKSRETESGGLVMNIGVHLFDILGWMFGPPHRCTVHLNRPECAAGNLHYNRARVRWFLSVNPDHLPPVQKVNGRTSYRSLTVNGREWELSDGFSSLHTASYTEILAGRGFGIDHVRLSLETVHQIRTLPEIALANDYHPYCRLMSKL